MTDKAQTQSTNWQSFAEEAMDLWQAQLAATAADPKAKEEMARMMTPFSQMFAEWSSAMQQAQTHARHASQTNAPAPESSGHRTEAPEYPGANEAGPAFSGNRCGGAFAPEEPEPADAPCGDTTVGTCDPAPDDETKTATSGGPSFADSDSCLVQLAACVAKLNQKLEDLTTRVADLEKSDQRARRNALLAARAQAIRAADGKE